MFRFTIRDVLWLMVVVGLGCGWWIEHRRATWQALIHARDNANLTEAVRRSALDRERHKHEVNSMSTLLTTKLQENEELLKDRLVRGINEGHRAAK